MPASLPLYLDPWVAPTRPVSLLTLPPVPPPTPPLPPPCRGLRGGRRVLQRPAAAAAAHHRGGPPARQREEAPHGGLVRGHTDKDKGRQGQGGATVTRTRWGHGMRTRCAKRARGGIDQPASGPQGTPGLSSGQAAAAAGDLICLTGDADLPYGYY